MRALQCSFLYLMLVVLHGCSTMAFPTSFDQQLFAANQQIVTINNLITNAVIRKQLKPDRATEISMKVDNAKKDLDAIKAIKYTISGQEGLQRTQAILTLLTEIEGNLQ